MINWAEYGRKILTEQKLSSQERSLMEAHVRAAELSGVLLQRTPAVESQKEILQFPPETRQELERRGYVVHDLTGQSIASLRKAGKPFWSTWHQNYPEFEAVTSRLSQVAINPDPEGFFLPDSNRKPAGEQGKMIATFSKKLRVPGADVALGSVADYAELAFTHLDKTGTRLFGADYNYDYTRTSTSVGADRAIVGYFYADCGLYVNRWHPDDRDDDLWVSPLVVPTGK